MLISNLEEFLVDDEADDDVRPLDFTRLYNSGGAVARETEELESLAALAKWKKRRETVYHDAILHGSGNLPGLVEAGDRTYWLVHVRVSLYLVCWYLGVY